MVVVATNFSSSRAKIPNPNTRKIILNLILLEGIRRQIPKLLLNFPIVSARSVSRQRRCPLTRGHLDTDRSSITISFSRKIDAARTTFPSPLPPLEKGGSNIFDRIATTGFPSREVKAARSRARTSSDEAELAPVHVRETAWVDIQPCCRHQPTDRPPTHSPPRSPFPSSLHSTPTDPVDQRFREQGGEGGEEERRRR